MKLISVETPATKAVEYFGLTINVPIDTRYLATDADGEVWSFEFAPTPETDMWNWWAAGSENTSDHVANVDLEGLDWRETLVELPE